MSRVWPAGSDVDADPWQALFRSLPGEIALAADRGLPVVFRCAAEPPAHVRKLMDTLGVQVEVVPVSRSTARSSVNQDVKVIGSADGEIVVMSAWCPTCKQQSTPNKRGECMFCGDRIVDEDTLSSSAMRDQIINGNGHPAATKNVYGRTVWTSDAIIAAMKEWAAAHGGNPPTTAQWMRADPEKKRPATHNVYEAGKFADFIEAAGFARPTSGPKTKVSGSEPLAQTSPVETAVGSGASGNDRPASPKPKVPAVELGSHPDEHTGLDHPASALVAELLRRLADAIDVGLFRNGNLALIFDGLAQETRRRLTDRAPVSPRTDGQQK